MVSRNNRIKRVDRVGAWTGTLKTSTKCLWRGSPTVGPTSSSVRLQIYVPSHNYMTEISLNVTLSNINLTHSSQWFPNKCDCPYFIFDRIIFLNVFAI